MDTAILKKINQEKVKSVLKAEKYSNKISLSKATGLSVATCGNVLNELLSIGEVVEIEYAQSTGGRRSRQFKYNENFAYVLSIYARIEGTSKNLYFAVSNLYGEKITDEYLYYNTISLTEIDNLIQTLLDEYEQIKAISIGLPGVIDNGKVSFCDFKELCNLNIVDHITEKFNIPTKIENDVNCAALGFSNKNGYHEDESFAYIYYPVDDGPGVGLMVNGSLLHGCTNFAGEVSFLPFTNSDLKENSKELFINHVNNTICSITCILNPKIIVLSGFRFSENDIETINSSIHALIPNPHVPEIIFEEDFHDSYLYGLTTMALELFTTTF